MTSRRTEEGGLPWFKPYPEYKDCGVEWLGEIPAHWNMLSLKRVCRFCYGDSLAAGERIDGDFEVFGSNGPVGTHDRANTLGPCLIVGRKGSFGRVNYSPNPVFAIDTTFFVDQRVTSADLGWLCHALTWLRLDSVSKDSAIPGLDREDAYACLVPNCTPAEQRAIATFLDRETAKIDALVAKKERLIGLLREKRTALITRAVTKGLDPNVPMKDSGVEWLDQYPAHWTGLPLKRWVAVKITDGPHETPELVNEGVDFISAEAVSNGRIDFDKRRGFISPGLHAYYCRKCKPVRDDILVCKSGATTGKLARVDVDFEFSVWSPLAVVRSHRSRILPRFLEMALGSEYVQKQIKRTWSAGTQPNISMGDLEQLYVVAPNIEEQAKILAYLDQEAGGFDALVAKVRDAIDRLKELRTALISSAVTGKIDVREHAT